MKKRFILFFMMFCSVNLFAKVNLFDYSKGYSDSKAGGSIILHETKQSGIKNNIYLRQENGSLNSKPLSGFNSSSGDIKVDRLLIPIDVNISYKEPHKPPTIKANYCLKVTNTGSTFNNITYTLLTKKEKNSININESKPLPEMVGTNKTPWKKLSSMPGGNHKIQGFIYHTFKKDFYSTINQDYNDGKICVIANNGDTIYIIAEPYGWSNPSQSPVPKFSVDPRFSIDYEAIPGSPTSSDVQTIVEKIRVVNEWAGDGGDENIYTQLIGGNVHTKISFSEKFSPQDAENLANWYYENGLKFQIKLMANILKVGGGKVDIDDKELTKEEFKKLLINGMIDLGNFTITNYQPGSPPFDSEKVYLLDYKNLYFNVEISNIPTSQPLVLEASNYFSARPAKFRLDIPNNNNVLIGGKKYYKEDAQISNIEALDAKGLKIYSYNVTLDVNNKILDSLGKPVISNIVTWDTKDLKKGQCVDEQNKLLVANTNVPNKSIVKFTDGKGFIFNGCKNELNFLAGIIDEKTCFFKYPDIGPTKITIYDNIFTKADQDRAKYCTSAAVNDATVRFCLPQTAYTDNRREKTTIWTKCFGKLVDRELYNCNVRLDVDFYRFKISTLFADADIVNSDGDMTYYSDQVYSPDGNKTFGLKNKTDYKNFKGANLNLIIKATLEDNSTTKLYTKNCYAKDVNLQLDYDDTGVQPNDFTFKRDLTNGQDIYFYALENNVSSNDDDPNIFKKVGDLYINNGKFYIKSDSFLYGKTTSSLKINLGREYNKAKDPKQVPSTRIIFDGNDTDGVKFYKNSSSTTPSFGNFFYGRVFTPDYEFMISSKNDENIINTYYIAYCKNSCNNPTIKSILSVDKHENFLPAYYYIFKNLNVNASNNKLKYAVFNGASGLNPKLDTLPNREIKNGIEMFKVKYIQDQFPIIFTIKGYFDKDIDPLFPKYLIYDEYYTPSSDLPNSFMFNLRFDNNLNRNWAGYGEQGNVLGIDDKNKDRKRIGNRRIDW